MQIDTVMEDKENTLMSEQGEEEEELKKPEDKRISDASED